MNMDQFRELAVETVTNPRSAAVKVIALSPGRDILWQILLLVVILNALVFGIGNVISPTAQPLPPMMSTPFLFGLTMACGLVITVFGVFWTGAWLGGQGRLGDLLALIVWLQVLRLVVQVGATFLALVAPGLTVMALMIVSILGLWILVNFIDVAHRFDNILKSFGTLLLSALGIVFGLILMLTIIGATTTGFMPDV